jgi:hypothetical protein
MSYDPLKLEDLTPEQQANLREIYRLIVNYGSLSNYVNRLHIITSTNGMCMCGEDGLTCSERLALVSPDIRNALMSTRLIP